MMCARKPIRIRAGGGFSLIEVLAALAIFGFAVVPLIQGIGMSLAHWRVTEEKTKALMLAENVIEEIIYNGDISPGEEEGQYEEPDDRYMWSSVIEETEVTGLYEVTVMVAWPADSPDPDKVRNVALTTLRTNHNQTRQQFAAQE